MKDKNNGTKKAGDGGIEIHPAKVVCPGCRGEKKVQRMKGSGMEQCADCRGKGTVEGVQIYNCQISVSNGRMYVRRHDRKIQCRMNIEGKVRGMLTCDEISLSVR